MAKAYAILRCEEVPLGGDAENARRVESVFLGDIDGSLSEARCGDAVGARRRARREAEVMAETLASMRRAGLTEDQTDAARVVIWDGESYDGAAVFPGASAPFVDVLDYDGRVLWRAADMAYRYGR